MSFGVCFFSTLFTLTSILQQSSLDYTWEFAARHSDFVTDILLLGKGFELDPTKLAKNGQVQF